MNLLLQILDDKSSISSTRLCMLLALIIAGVIGVYAIVNGKDLTGTAVLVGSFIGPAFALKGYQKSVEVKKDEA